MRNATDLRESDLLKYPEFAEYSGRRNERKRQRLSPSATTTSAIVTHNENWKEIVEVLRSAIEEASSFLLYVNSVISCLRLLGWKKSNGTIQIESNNRVDEQQCIFLIHENDKRPIPCIVTKNNNADAIVSRADSIASYLDGINKCIGILFGECIEIFFQNTEDNKPTSIASIELDNSVLLGEVLCNLLEYNTFNYHKLVTFCMQQFKQVHNETNL